MSSTNSPVSRRGFLRGVASVGIAGSLAGCYATGGQSRSGSGGGSVAGGGVGAGFAFKNPAVSRNQATHVSRTPDQLDAAIDAGTPQSPSVIWIPPDAAIDYSGRSRTIENAVIASTRQSQGGGSGSHAGGLIYSSSMGSSSSAFSGGSVEGMFEMGQNSRLTGIRLRGPTYQTWDSRWFPGFIPFASGGSAAREEYRQNRHSRGVTITSGSVQIDNCEFFGWSTQAIVTNCPQSVGTSTKQSYPQISNCLITNSGMSGYGYGVESIMGHPVIQRCYFNATRHAVATFGYPSSGYTVSDSVFGPATLMFSADVHSLGENSSGSSSDPSDPRYRYRASGLVRIRRNVFTFDESMMIAPSDSLSAGGNPFAGDQQHAISVGGIPWKKCVIKGNTFVHDSFESAVHQSHTSAAPDSAIGPRGYAKFETGNNRFGAQFGYPVG